MRSNLICDINDMGDRSQAFYINLISQVSGRTCRCLVMTQAYGMTSFGGGTPDRRECLLLPKIGGACFRSSAIR